VSASVFETLIQALFRSTADRAATYADDKRPEYIPDLVTETGPTIFMVETKARSGMNT
jgi:hypothetical protein